MKVNLENIAVDYFNVVEFAERFVEHRQKPCVKLNADNLLCTFCKLCGQHADSCSDLEHTDTLSCSALLGNSRANTGVDYEVLTECLGKSEAVTAQYGFNYAYI